MVELHSKPWFVPQQIQEIRNNKYNKTKEGITKKSGVF
jgi:hypothetical protein